jgi:TolA-binding protein
VGAAAGLLVLAAAIYFVQAGSQRANERAAGMLADARGDFQRGALDPAATRLEELLSTSGGTAPGKQALILYGDVRYAQGRYQDAAGYYRRAIDKFQGDPIVGAAARRALAATLENMKEYEEAAKIHEELLGSEAAGPLRTQAQLDLARNLLRAGQTDRAKVLYEEVSINQDSPVAAQEAQMRLAEIKAAQVAG